MVYGFSMAFGLGVETGWVFGTHSFCMVCLGYTLTVGYRTKDMMIGNP